MAESRHITRRAAIVGAVSSATLAIPAAMAAQEKPDYFDIQYYFEEFAKSLQAHVGQLGGKWEVTVTGDGPDQPMWMRRDMLSSEQRSRRINLEYHLYMAKKIMAEMDPTITGWHTAFDSDTAAFGSLVAYRG